MGVARAACWLPHDPSWGTLFSVAGAQLSVAEEEEVGVLSMVRLCVSEQAAAGLGLQAQSDGG